jgi:hypothetical protein
MGTTAIILAWSLAMLAAVTTHALGWRSWLRAFAHDGASSGSVDLPGEPQEVSKRIAHALVTAPGPVSARIVEADSRVVRAKLRPVLQSRRGRGELGSGGAGSAGLVCHIDRRMDGCRVDYSLDTGELGVGYRNITLGLLVLGSVAILAAAVIFPLLVIPSDNPAIRGQTAQVVQLVHFLWPPFLLTHQARRARAVTAEHTMDLMANLPWVSE